ncbi:MAG: hypothetical protein N2657_00145 [bacterium]|nr:hypothetical protein [bacterium]
MVGIRMCIFCRNKFHQDQLFRIFLFKDSLVFKYKSNFIDIFHMKNLKNHREILRNKSRSLYFCCDCSKKYLLNIDDFKKKQLVYKVFKYHLSKLKGYNHNIDSLIYSLKSIIYEIFYCWH